MPDEEEELTPTFEINLAIDYDLLESQRCLCGLRKDLGQKMCEPHWRTLTTAQQAKLAALRPGDGVAGVVAGMVER